MSTMVATESPSSPPPARPAATVVLLRDAPGGLEVFLMRRHGESDVLGGAYVFPGGKLDADDARLDMAAHLDQAPDALHQALGEPELDATTAASLYVAALREAFEESGILFAEDAATASAVDADAAAARLRGGQSFAALLAAMGLRLRTRDVAPWSRWVTPNVPTMMNKRFDTRFFVAAVPSDQTARHDDFETTHSVWLPPRTALEQYRDGLITMAAPQIMSLAHLARHQRVDSVLGAARARRPPVIQPASFTQGEDRILCYPGDPRHPVAERALPGPTRLRFRAQRFEPIDGFESLFA
jgi:8-oxo-dGTP pyrophosphatase MutT (NUDIX family)